MSKWNEEVVAQLEQIVGNNIDITVPVSQVETAATMLEVTAKSVAAKLRNMGYTVESMAADKKATFSEEETYELAEFIEANPNVYTYKEIAANVLEGRFSAKQVQGKILALELTSLVKPTEKVEAVAKYSEQEEAQFIEMVNAGAFIEDLANVFGRNVQSIRGKALSLLTKELIAKIPAQQFSTAKASADPLAELGDEIHNLSVFEIAERTGKTERGIKTSLTRRGITVLDYDGAAKNEKAKARRQDESVAFG